MAIMREGGDRLTPDQFCYWFQGFAELHGGVPTPEQWEIIKQHLELVFKPVANRPHADGVKPRGLIEQEEKVIRDIVAEAERMKKSPPFGLLPERSRNREVRYC
jgi:hypothetical protein